MVYIEASSEGPLWTRHMLLHHDAHCRSTLLRSHDFASLRDERRTGNTNRAPLDTLPETQLFLTTVLFRFSFSLFPLSLSLSLSPWTLHRTCKHISRARLLAPRDTPEQGCPCYFNDSLFGRVAAVEECVLGEWWWRSVFWIIFVFLFYGVSLFSAARYGNYTYTCACLFHA